MTATADAPALPELETVSKDGVATSEIPAIVGERITQALAICANGKWVQLPFASESDANTFDTQARAYCDEQDPAISFRRQTVFMADPEDDDAEVENPQVVRFRVTVKSAGRATRR